MNIVFVNVYKRVSNGIDGLVLIDTFVSDAERAIYMIEKNYPKYIQECIQENVDIRIEIERD